MSNSILNYSLQYDVNIFHTSTMNKLIMNIPYTVLNKKLKKKTVNESKEDKSLSQDTLVMSKT